MNCTSPLKELSSPLEGLVLGLSSCPHQQTHTHKDMLLLLSMNGHAQCSEATATGPLVGNPLQGLSRTGWTAILKRHSWEFVASKSTSFHRTAEATEAKQSHCSDGGEGQTHLTLPVGLIHLYDDQCSMPTTPAFGMSVPGTSIAGCLEVWKHSLKRVDGRALTTTMRTTAMVAAAAADDDDDDESFMMKMWRQDDVNHIGWTWSVRLQVHSSLLQQQHHQGQWSCDLLLRERQKI